MLIYTHHVRVYVHNVYYIIGDKGKEKKGGGAKGAKGGGKGKKGKKKGGKDDSLPKILPVSL